MCNNTATCTIATASYVELVTCGTHGLIIHTGLIIDTLNLKQVQTSMVITCIMATTEHVKYTNTGKALFPTELTHNSTFIHYV